MKMGTSVLKQSLGKYIKVMAILDFLLLQITNKSNLTWPNLISIPSPTTVLSKDLYFLHLMPDDFFKKLPNNIFRDR